MKKIFISLFIFIFSLIGILAYSIDCSAATTSEQIDPGIQQGVQTYDMTIDDGLEILGYQPSDFQIEYQINIYDSTDLKQYFGENGDKLDIAPIEFIGVTESYEFTESQGYIDTYIYFYTPYQLVFAVDDDYEFVNFTKFAHQQALMLQLNEDKMSTSNDGWWLNLVGYSDLEHHMQDYEDELSRAYITSEDEEGSICQGVTRLRIRVYTKDDLDVLRNYYVEKFIYTYEDYNTASDVSSSVIPSFNTTFSAMDENGDVDVDVEYDEEFTDTTKFVVPNRSVVMVEAIHYIYNWQYVLQKKSNCWILLRNSVTGEQIDNVLSLQIIYKLDGDKEYRTSIQDNFGSTNFYTFGNLFSKSGQFTSSTKATDKSFKNNIIPNLKNGYPYDEYPEYLWSWNYHLDEVETVYVWYEVEAGTVVQGSAYENGLHVEFDENGNALGVFDYKGNEVDGIDYTKDGILLDDDGNYRLPENSRIDLIYDQSGFDFSNLFDGFNEFGDFVLTLSSVFITILFIIGAVWLYKKISKSLK